jgi:uncharacterized membrane protein
MSATFLLSLLNMTLVLLPCAAALLLAHRTRWGGQLGAPLLVLLLSLALAATGLIPGPLDWPWISGPLTALAVAVLLLPLELRRLLPQARSLLGPFGAATGLVCAASIVWGVVLAGPLGQHHAALAGVLAAGYTGGTVNLVSVGKTLALPPAPMTLVLAADTVVGIGWFLISLVAGRGHVGEAAAAEPEQAIQPQQRRLRSTAVTLLIGLAVLALAAALQRLFAPLVLPSLLTVTTVALLVAQVPVVARQRLDQELGMLLLLPFFSLVGLQSSWRELFPAGGWLLLLASAIVAVQGIGLWILSRRQRLGFPQLLVASQAVIGGPATAVAVAAALGRRELILPAMALGMLGYLIGSYLGLGVAKVVSLLS